MSSVGVNQSLHRLIVIRSNRPQIGLSQNGYGNDDKDNYGGYDDSGDIAGNERIIMVVIKPCRNI